MPTATASPSKYTNDVLEEFISKAYQTIASTGIDDETASRIAVNLAIQLSEDWGGQLVYVAKRQARMARDLQIFADFTGTNLDALVARYGLSKRMLRIIIDRVRTIINSRMRKTGCCRRL